MSDELLEYLFGAASFVPHGFCLLWRPDLVAVHVIADVLTASAYFTIPIALFIFQRKRHDLQFRAIFILFAMFITLCGLSHLADLVTLWVPAYGLQGLIKLATGVVSVMTAVTLWRIIPAALALPSPTMLREVNLRLQQENAAKHEVEQELRRAHHELERRVEERTAELAMANQKLAASLDRQNIYLEHLPLAVIELTHEDAPSGWRIDQWSGRAEAILGWSANEAVGQTTASLGLVHPDDREQSASAASELLSGQVRRITLEQRLVTRSGEVRQGRHWISSRPDDVHGRPTVLVLVEDVTERNTVHARLEHMAFHDALTGLLNRTMFEERLDHAMSRAARDGRHVALLMLDLDDFKQVNDSYGHATGDELLQEVAARLVGAARQDDTWARLGGDEFVMIQEGIDTPDGAICAAKRILASMDDTFTIAGRRIDMKVSIGIAIWSEGGPGVEGLLGIADAALYKAKASGKGLLYLDGQVLPGTLRSDPHSTASATAFGRAFHSSP